MKATHPKCGKTFPGGDGSGHCSGCCETFIGLASFEAHRVGSHADNGRHCETQPYESTDPETGKTRYGHWQDDRGYWRFGRKLTKDEAKALWARHNEQDEAA